MARQHQDGALQPREVGQDPPHTDLGRLQAAEAEAAAAAMAGGALAAVAAFDPTRWTHVRVRLWQAPPAPEAGTQAYRVGYTSLGRMT